MRVVTFLTIDGTHVEMPYEQETLDVLQVMMVALETASLRGTLRLREICYLHDFDDKLCYPHRTAQMHARQANEVQYINRRCHGRI